MSGWAPRGKGRGRSGNTLPKASPIAKPDYDYERRIKERQYGDEYEKERREEQRRREAEERRQQREAGLKADLGSAGQYWEKVAGHGWTGGTLAYKEPTSGKGSYGKSMPALASFPASTGSPGPATARGAVEDPWFSGIDPWAVGSKPRSSSAKPSGTSRASSERPKEGGPVWGSDQAWWHDRGSERNASKQDANTTRGQAWDDGWKTEAWKNSRATQASQETESSPASSRWRARQVEKLDLVQPGKELTDEVLLRILGEFAAPAEKVPLVDLSHNKLTDAGITHLVGYILRNHLKVDEIRIQGNNLREPRSLLDLLRHDSVGLKAGMVRQLHLNVEDLSSEFFWRLLEVCVVFKPRPPVQLFLPDGQLGHHKEVLLEGISRGLMADGPILPLAIGSKAASDVDLLLVNEPVLGSGVYQ